MNEDSRWKNYAKMKLIRVVYVVCSYKIYLFVQVLMRMTEQCKIDIVIYFIGFHRIK